MTSETRSICFVAPSAASVLFGGLLPGGGGAERQLSLLGSALADCGWQVGYVTGPEGDPAQLVDRRFRIERAPFHFLSGRRSRILSDLPAIWRALGRQPARIVGLRTGGPVLLALLKVWCVLHGAKLVLWLQSDGDFARHAGRARAESVSRRLARWIYQRQILSADLLVVQKEEQRAAVAARSERPCVFVPSLSPVAPVPAGAPGEPLVLWAGNPSRNKRAGLVLELARQLPDCRFALAMNPGDPAAFERARAAAAALPNVQFLGSVPPREMETWFDRAAVVLNTSILEGVPNTFLQAWSRGLPVVTAGVDPDGLVAGQSLGCVVPVAEGDTAAVAALAGTLRRLLADPGERAALGRAGLAYIVARHAPATVGPRLDRLLSHLLKDRKEFLAHVRQPVR